MTTTIQTGSQQDAPTATPRAAFAPQQLEVLRLFVDGNTLQQTATRLGIGVETCKSQIVKARKRLTAEGHDVSNVIKLRRALRQLGRLDGIELL